MPHPTQNNVASKIGPLIDAAVSQRRLSPTGASNLRRWLGEPQYSVYRSRLVELIETDQFETLDSLFWEVIPFGTGGRRGPMAEFGSATINERTIAESADGVATYWKRLKGGGGGKAVVAFDCRNRSQEFARLTATTWAAHGLKVYYFESSRATPELSFAVRHLACDIGAMISASHNPPSDNGFKAYWTGGGQVLPPHDLGIIDCVYQAGEIPKTDFDAAVARGQIEIVGESVDQLYCDAVAALSLSEARDFPALFTPLHGVGETSVVKVLDAAGFQGVEIFEPQRAPDGNFTNVPDQLPNPERPDVFQPAMDHAGRTGAELILASDPDADRLGICVKGRDGRFVYLTGNRVGALLADYILRKRSAAGTLPKDGYVVDTLVTTPLISAIAAKHGVRAIGDLLVGFKYIAETIDREGPERFLFGAEESLGYLAGSYCRDKDAAVAALYVMELAAELRADGKTLLDRLDDLFVDHGFHVEAQLSKVCRGARGQEQIAALMGDFRESPPTQIGDVTFSRVRDYGSHEIRDLATNKKFADLPEPQGELLIFDSTPGETQVSVAVRPSGTEPKIKFYFFARCGCPNRESLEELKLRTNRMFVRVQEAFNAWVDATLARMG